MAGLPWIKVHTDLPRDPRSLHLADLLEDGRAWTYVLQMRLYLAEHSSTATGCVSGPGAVASLERAAGWTGTRGRLVDAMRDAGFVRAGPARDGNGTEIEDLDWVKDQGAHVKKVERDAKKPRGNAHAVVCPSRDIGGTREGSASSSLYSQISDLQLGGLGGTKPADEPSRDKPPGAASHPEEPDGAQGAGNVIALPVSNSERNAGGQPPAESLPDGVERVNRAVRGSGYPWDARTDEPASRKLIAMAGAGGVPEVLRRFENGLRAQFKQRVDSLRELIPKWNANTQPEDKGGHARGPVPASSFANPRQMQELPEWGGKS